MRNWRHFRSPTRQNGYGVGVRRCIALRQQGVFGRGYTRGGFLHRYLGVSLQKEREARLIFWFGNANDDDLTADLLSQDDWHPESDEYGYWSKKDLARIEAGCVPLKRLKSAAASALAVITR